jgi:hypothetical protein
VCPRIAQPAVQCRIRRIAGKVGVYRVCTGLGFIRAHPTMRSDLGSYELTRVRWARMVSQRAAACLASTRSSQLSYTRESEEVLVAARLWGVNQWPEVVRPTPHLSYQLRVAKRLRGRLLRAVSRDAGRRGACRASLRPSSEGPVVNCRTFGSRG